MSDYKLAYALIAQIVKCELKHFSVFFLILPVIEKNEVITGCGFSSENEGLSSQKGLRDSGIAWVHFDDMGKRGRRPLANLAAIDLTSRLRKGIFPYFVYDFKSLQ